jgi:16S rRNA (cytosine1402-N4)-methyltransferase
VSALQHLPVLLEEVLAVLNVQGDGIYVDATYGRGGHAAAILDRLGARGRLLAIDRDPEAVAAAQKRFGGDVRFSIIRGRFSMLKQYVAHSDWIGRVDGIVLDLGVSSPQLDDPARGFSFQKSGPLDMRMDPEAGMSAAQWLSTAKEAEIAAVLRTLGEERFAKRIANMIVSQRSVQPIETTAYLAEIIAGAVPTREPGKDPATRSFQAIRMHLNQELTELETTLPQCLDVLAPGGRLSVISFHSLEDRLVKRFMRTEAKGDPFPSDLPVRQASLSPRLRLLGKAARASAAEIRQNPRARSAVLRAAERIAPAHG